MKLKTPYSTKQVAGMIGVDRMTLQKWIRDGKAKASFVTEFDSWGRKLYRWSPEDVKKLRRFKAEHGGRWPKSAKQPPMQE